MPKHAVIYGDVHVPFQDPAALEIVKDIIVAVQPEVVVNIGDLFDCASISKFPKDPRRKDSLQDEIYLGAEHLREIRDLSLHADHYLFEGNHEERLRRTIWNMNDGARELAGLDVFDKYINWETILADANVDGWNFIPYDEQPVQILPIKLLTKHGTKLASGMGASGRTAFKEWITYGMSGMSGHSHRLGDFFHRDRNGSHRWIETGCCCELSGVPGGSPDHDWHQGCVVITYTDDWFNCELVYIQDGRAMWRDEVIEV